MGGGDELDMNTSEAHLDKCSKLEVNKGMDPVSGGHSGVGEEMRQSTPEPRGGRKCAGCELSAWELDMPIWCWMRENMCHVCILFLSSTTCCLCTYSILDE